MDEACDATRGVQAVRNLNSVLKFFAVLVLAFLAVALSGCFFDHTGGAGGGWEMMERPSQRAVSPARPVASRPASSGTVSSGRDQEDDNRLFTIFVLLLAPLAILALSGHGQMRWLVIGLAVSFVVFVVMAPFSPMAFLFLPMGAAALGVGAARRRSRGGYAPAPVRHYVPAAPTCIPARRPPLVNYYIIGDEPSGSGSSPGSSSGSSGSGSDHSGQHRQ